MKRILMILIAFSYIYIVFAVEGGVPEIAGQVKIYRDKYWVAHIFGKTDAACAFGMGYAQAEDNLSQIIQSIRQATGRLAEVQGEEALEHDAMIHLMRIPQFAHENYTQIPSEFREVIESYCSGVNFYAEKHPDKVPRGWYTIAPQDIVAAVRYCVLMVFTGIPGSANNMIERAEASAGNESGDPYTVSNEGIGSNTWAVSPVKSTIDKAMLVINPHLPWDGLLQWWEAHIESEQGWNIMGATLFCSPVIFVGFSEKLGWSHTVNSPDIWDVYRVELNPENPNQYRYEDEWRDISTIRETLRVKRSDNIEEVSRDLEYTHYGPILRRTSDHAYTLKMANWDDVLSIYQWYRMNKAKSLEEFKEAMRMMALPMFNVGYADADNNIFYVYNGKVAHKDGNVNWREVVDGGKKETEWREYMTFDELPQVLNPKSGFVQNCNTTPFETTAKDDNPKKEDFPTYIAPEGMGSRAQRLRQVLEEKDRFSIEDFIEMPWDILSLTASRTVPYLVQIARDASRDEDFLRAVEILSSWDFRAGKDSEAMSIFYWWLMSYAERAKKIYAEPDSSGLGAYRGIGEPEIAITALQESVSNIRKWYGRFPISWGEIHRMRHGGLDLPLAGADGERFGMLASLGGRPGDEDKHIYVTGGHSYIAVVAFTKPLQAWSIFPYGNNRQDPESEHYTDQTRLFADFQFKPAWFTKEDILKNVEKIYSPGE